MNKLKQISLKFYLKKNIQNTKKNTYYKDIKRKKKSNF